MSKIEIYWGADEDFDTATSKLNDVHYLIDVMNHINKTDLKVEGANLQNDPPMKVENLLIHTDDYGGVREWALLGFSNNILRNEKVKIKNLWLCNPPTNIYKDILKNYKSELITEHKTQYPDITLDQMRNISRGFNNVVIGQPKVMPAILSAIYSLQNINRKKPVTLLFLGDSGI